VAHKPWRATKAEACFHAAAEAELADAAGLEHNGFKITLARRTLGAVLIQLQAEQQQEAA
jgi:xanthine dehydrogenase YagS FAD-binding subunit